MDSGSPSRKHPRSDAFASAAASLAPPNKRRRTTVLCNPIPQNLLNGVSSPYAKYNRNAGSQTPAGTSSTSGLTSAKQSDTHSVTSSTGRSRLAEQVRSFAPKPLMSPFAARTVLKSRSFGASTLRHTTSAAGPSVRSSNGSYSRPSSRAGSVAFPMSPPAPRPMSVIGGGLFTPAKPAATPTRRIHHPDFSFDNKPPPSSFRFTANDSPASTPTAQSSGITSRAHTPARRGPARGSPSVSFSSGVSPAARRASPAESMARADSILGFFSSSLDKARQALAGNRADRLEEKRQKEKEAIRKQMEEDERIRRAEIFERELEREEEELREEMERIGERKRMKEQEEIEKREEREERAAEAQKPSFFFSHTPSRKDAPSDGGSSQWLEGEYYENEEYGREDDSRDYEEGEEGEYGEEEFEEDAEAEEGYEEGEEVSTTPRLYAMEDDEIEEVIEEFGSEPAEDSDRLDQVEMDQYDAKAEGEYEEEETEKDDTDTERIVEWKPPKVSKDEDPDRSLGSTALLPSQPTSFANKRPVSADNVPSDSERTPVPEDSPRPPEPPQEPGPAQRGQSVEPKVFSRENSEEPEVRALRNRNVVVNRGRSVSIEPSAGESDTGRAPKRIKRGHSTQPTAPSRDSSEEPEVRALRNRTVIVNRGRSASVELSASETDTAGGGPRRKTRSAKAVAPEAPSTPKKKGKKAVELPLSSIKEVVPEDSPRKNARATRKK
ncbi:hypothetical protein C7212DRAFT_166134 [Tuber magnatum]|uniref:Uncharacterized protein n=1 Tax=Tuber magnatum TaxID=42249 RepID=A0A317SW68_9PEZI|nr:hypothetical protein C7212DRAFT_166134 [Tuber magnatum]